MSARRAPHAVDLGSVETEAPLRSGRCRRAVLAAHPATCDLYVYGADGCVRVFNPKAALWCSRRLQPRLLDPRFLRSHDQFWSDQRDIQERLVERGAADEELPFEVVEVHASESGGWLALVG